jgi:ubiquinol-cytochrome c reductase iron-sulfur subunit
VKLPQRLDREQRAELLVGAMFGLTLLSGVGLLVLYLAGGQTQLEGILLFLCLGGLGAGLVIWSHRLMPSPIREEIRHPLASDPAVRQELLDQLVNEGGIGRRRFLLRVLGAALVGLGAALAMPILSLGPNPGRSLFQTDWKPGLRLVGIDGKPVTAGELPIGSIATVFPEGVPGSADAQTVLLHLDPALLQLTGDAASWAPQGYVAYSKICTHAGCPVGLFREESNELICPCHQSTFDVLRGAVPVYGPAARPLPQLPMRLEADGTFTCLADFPEPVGPSFWNVHQ